MSRPLQRQSNTDVIFRDPAAGIVLASGTTVPSDAAIGYAPGCFFIDSDASGAAAWYRNEGTNASADFNVFAGGLSLEGLTATAAEINRTTDISLRSVTLAAASTTTLSAATHGDKTLVTSSTASASLQVNLPAATGTGLKTTIVVGVTVATNKLFVVATGAVIFGTCITISDGAAAVLGYSAAGVTTITFDGTTQGGLKGDVIELQDVATNIWLARVTSTSSGSEATPFS